MLYPAELRALCADMFSHIGKVTVTVYEKHQTLKPQGSAEGGAIIPKKG